MRRGIVFAAAIAFSAAQAWCLPQTIADSEVTVDANWKDVVRVSRTVATTQHLANAMTLRDSPLNKPLLKALRDLHTNDTRLQLWFSVPNQVVAELKEPTATETHWDFRYMDPVVIDFYANTSGQRHINIGTIPRWMFKVPPVEIPKDPASSSYIYVEGTRGELLKDPTGQEFAEYQARVFHWYTQGGFTDEIGKYHKSGYHFKINYWGVLNEPPLENKISVEVYTRVYDAVTKAIHKIDPKVQFFGPEITGGRALFTFEKYFLNPKNHDPDAPPVQWFSLHNYVIADNSPATWQEQFFTAPKNRWGATASGFSDLLSKILQIRDELSPNTKIAIDELGTFDSVKPEDDAAQAAEPYRAYNPLYWVASGANWAADFVAAEKLGIELVSMSQLVGAPTQSESCSMINWDTAHPNAHYWVLSLIHHHFGPGDKLVATESSSPNLLAQASRTPSGRKVLLINTSNHVLQVNLSSAFSGSVLRMDVVDKASGEQPPRREHIRSSRITLAPFAVAVAEAIRQ
jgi:hypothetical protein